MRAAEGQRDRWLHNGGSGDDDARLRARHSPPPATRFRKEFNEILQLAQASGPRRSLVGSDCDACRRSDHGNHGYALDDAYGTTHTP